VRVAPERPRPGSDARRETEATVAAAAAVAEAAEAHAVLARLERYIAHHPPRRAPVRVVHTARGDIEEADDSIGILLATAAQPVAVLCCIAIVTLFEHANHTVASVVALLLGSGAVSAAVRRIPMSLAVTIGILAGLAVGRLS